MSSGSSISTKGATRPGHTLATKGIIDEATVTNADIEAPAFALALTRGPIVIIVPTPANFMLMAVENVLANLRVQQPANLQLPSLYKRAFLVAYETDEIAVVKP